MIKTIQGFAHAHKNQWTTKSDDWQIEGFDLSIWKHDDMTACGYMLVAPAVITIEIPDSWDPRQVMVEVLRKEQQKIREEYQARVQQLEDEIGKYLAIGN